jgi:hypothetical protein
MEYQAEWEKLMRRGSDYDELLRFGQVVARAEDVEEWRREIRAQVRADKLRVRTFVPNEEERIVLAVLVGRRTDEQILEDVQAGYAAMPVLDEASGRARLYGHHPSRFRSEGKRSAAACVRCGASIYVDRSHDAPVIDGTAFEG